MSTHITTPTAAKSFDVGHELTKMDKRIEKILGPKVEAPVLLGQLDGLMRNRPTVDDIAQQTEASLEWRGRAAAVVHAWDSVAAVDLRSIFASFDSGNSLINNPKEGYAKLVSLLHRARHDLQMQTMGPQSVVVEQGKPYDFFEYVRRIIERASQEVLFIDQYLNADFANRYLPSIAKGVSVRLLTSREYISKLLPAVDMFVKQTGTAVAIRTADFHDRYIFIDRRECHKSGGSFKDGGHSDPGSLSQIVDAFDATLAIYEAKWAGGKVER